MPRSRSTTLCQEAKDAGVTAPDGFTVRLVTDIGKVDDRTFNQYAYEGMQAAKECFGFETSYIETASEADYAKNIDTALDGDPDALVTVGFLLATDTLAAAQANPDTDFIGVDQFQTEFPDNYTGILFNEDEGGYLAGVLAASLSKSGIIGVVGGREDVPPVVKLVNGYEMGAKSVNPDIRVLKIYNESFTAPDKGASDAQQFIGEGADVIFGAGGKTGSGGVAAATSQGVWGIGVDQDEYFTTFNGGQAPGSEYLASSAVKRVDLGVFNEIVAGSEGRVHRRHLRPDGGERRHHLRPVPRRRTSPTTWPPSWRRPARASRTAPSRPASTPPRASRSRTAAGRGAGSPAPRLAARTPPMSDDGRTPILEVRGLTKTFPGVIANEDVDFTLHEGEVHCLLGENGAGKSTLMNAVFGLYQPDAGQILLRGDPVHFTSSRDAIAHGIGMVHQHFQLIPVFSVAENVILGQRAAPGTAARPRHRPHPDPRPGQALRAPRRPGRARRRPLGRRAAARRAGEGPLPRSRHPHPRRAHRGPHPR